MNRGERGRPFAAGSVPESRTCYAIGVALEPSILNAGLSLAMAFGADWLKPIQERLAAIHPTLSKRQLDEYDAACRRVMAEGHRRVGELLARTKGNHALAQERFVDELRARYAWIDDANLSRLFSQGCYYAMK